MKTIFHQADSRGFANHGWLKSHHTFSFANYYNPERIHFGTLRVLNDDQVIGGMGFGAHPHDNMEIISIPLEGDLEHKDSMGNHGIIRHGEIQVMSAGTGVVHSEFNANKEKDVKFLQIWLFPRERNVTPRYDQKKIDGDQNNQFLQILSPNQNTEGVWIHQDAWFSLTTMDQDFETTYDVKKNGNGVYFFILEGSAEIVGQEMERRDGLGVWETDKITVKSTSDSTKILVMDVPMEM